MTYSVERDNFPEVPKGTIRKWFDHDGGYYGISEPGDPYRCSAMLWWSDGEFFDGKSWWPVEEYNAWLEGASIDHGRRK